VSEHCPRESYYEKTGLLKERRFQTGRERREEGGGQKDELSASRKLCGEGEDFNARLRDPKNNGGE